MKRKSVNVYVHTIRGALAMYFPGSQICFASNGTQLHSILVRSLRELKKQQNASKKWRIKNGASIDDIGYGYLRLTVTTDD